uniref:AraC family transcriptional regulator n=1 Tax=Pedobacter schmidteae TaxID=2201271 RepID=UPI0018D59044|nr:AraC family transcriptional regulator [Pedobacter schmidteae]
MKKKKDGFQGQKAIVLPRTIISKYCIDNSLISGAYLTDIGYYPKAKFHYRVRSQGIDQHILIYNQEGSGWAEVGDRKYNIGSGDFFIVPAGYANRYAADEKNPWSIYWIHFKGPTADAFVKTYFERTGSYAGTLSYNQSRIDIFEELYKHLERGYGHDNLSYVNLLLLHFLSSFLFDGIFNEASSTEQLLDVVHESILYMQENMSSALSLQDLSVHANVSVSHFVFLFKKKTGFSPIEYFNHLKVQKACQYLQFTTMRVKEIAYQLGMEDPYYFSRLFTKVMSMSPKEYRNKFTVKL